MPSHALSLLLTCRKIYLDATLFAFNIRTVTLSKHGLVPTYLALEGLTSLLSEPHPNSIFRLAYDVPYVGPRALVLSVQYFTHSLLIFPALRHLELRITRRQTRVLGVFHDSSPLPCLISSVSYLLDHTVNMMISG
jgi:hypothetical protein